MSHVPEDTPGAMTAETPPAPAHAAAPMWAYVAPMLAFLLITSAEGYLPKVDGRPDPHWYPWIYAAKAAIVAVAAWVCRATWRDLRPLPDLAGLGLAIGAGLVVAVAWVGLHGHYPVWGEMGERSAFDPNVLSPTARLAFLAVRLFGLILLVPLIEELFWRSFLLRWIIAEPFGQVPIGKVTLQAAAITAGLFAAAHPQEWLPALLTGLLWAGLLWRTKSVSACVISHAVANAALGAYILATGAWWFW